MNKYLSRGPEQTKNFGKDLAYRLKPGNIIALTGDLGAGKTTLIQGIAEGLNIDDYVTSPSFTLINEYSGKYKLFHVDLYRLDNLDQIEELGIYEYFEKDGIVVIEWAEKMQPLLPERTWKIEMEIIDENSRNIICH